MGVGEQLSYAFGALSARARDAKREDGVVAAARVVLEALPVVAQELAGTASLAPYGARAALCHRRMAREGRLLERRYGAKAANRVDVYLPPAQAAARAEANALRPPMSTVSASSRPPAPVPCVLFVPGGVWVNCEAWQYSLLASRLADEGAVAAVMQYTTFPYAQQGEMSREVGQALDWLRAEASALGGDPGRITLLAHSAGCQLASSELLRRALKAAELHATAATDAGEYTGDTGINTATPWQPHAFVGMSGVYDIAAHFEHELSRGVAHVSTMRPACGFEEGFAEASPALRLREAYARAPEAAREALCLALPRCVLMSSRSDVVVPPAASERLVESFEAVGARHKVTHLAYERIGHADFAVGWHPSAPQCDASALDEAPLLVSRAAQAVRARRRLRAGGGSGDVVADAACTLAPVADALAMVLGAAPAQLVPPGRLDRASAAPAARPAGPSNGGAADVSA